MMGMSFNILEIPFEFLKKKPARQLNIH